MELQKTLAINDEATAFADVILPVPIPKYFRYRVPRDLVGLVKPGVRVLVPFGQRRILTAIVHSVHHNPPPKVTAKYVLDVLDQTPIASPGLIGFWEWMAGYYACYVGEVLNVALPAGLKLTSQSQLQLNPAFAYFPPSEKEGISQAGEELLETIGQKGTLPYEDASKLLGLNDAHRVIKELVGKKAIIIFEQVKEKYRPKKIKKIRLAEGFAEGESSLEALFGSLSGKPKQEEVLLKYLSLVPLHDDPAANARGIDKNVLKQGLSDSSLRTLLNNGVFEEWEEIVSRFDEAVYLEASGKALPMPVLNEAQALAKAAINQWFERQSVCLLHGITGSGKTEIYITLMQEVLDNGYQVLFLVPEIVLTAQTVARLRKVFGQRLGVYHSRFSDNERVEVWQGVANGRFDVVIGVRSAIFLPFEHLGLVVIDEEHEHSYKQYEPAPRYHARDSAIMLAHRQHAKVLLGSATPSIESFHLAKQGKYGYVKLDQRFGNATLPTIGTADLSKERQAKTMHQGFSSQLLAGIKKYLEAKQQVILFQNRRGYAPYLSCESCQWIPTCSNCSVSLTLHLHSNELRCHYCGHAEQPPSACVSCGSTKIKTVGMGTEKIEEELQSLLPEARIQRLDQDTARKKHGYQQIISDFEDRQIDVLIGTQMVSKGLDFEGVGLVGVFDIDRMIHFPDFRAQERAFQLVTQVSGRTGRRESPGEVIIQTANPMQPLVQKVLAQDYEAFFAYEINEREKFQYPPFTRLICLTAKHEKREVADAAAEKLAEILLPQLGKSRLLGPEYPIIDRIRNQYRKDLMVKLERGKINLPKVKVTILESVAALVGKKEFRKVQFVVDVDPL